MYEKNSRFYADWRNAEGKRLRKSFPTALGAQRHEKAQLKLRPSRDAGLQTNCPKSSGVLAGRTKATVGERLHALSSPPVGKKGSKAFHPAMSSQHKRPIVPTPTPRAG